MSAWRIRLETNLAAVAAVTAVVVLSLVAAVVLVALRSSSGDPTPATTAPVRTLDEVIADPGTDPACRDALRALDEAPPSAPVTPSPSNPFGIDPLAAQRAAEVARACTDGG